ncbi:MAG: hypothetical protein IV093_04290 [Rubrivivax sp.]|nr:hypothetical protein [Rubrivivax sp.]
MRRTIHLLQRSVPLWITADDLAGKLLEALPGTVDTSEQGALGERLRASPAAIVDVLGELMTRSDTAQRHAPALLRQLLPSSPVRHYVSLGTHCFTASLLRRWGLRNWAGPFDWLFSSVEMVTHCIEDDFATFLDRSLYQPVPVEQRPHGPSVNRVHHTVYRERFAIDYVFNHHDAHLDADHGHFQRAVMRFRSLLCADEPVVFVVTRTQGEGPVDDLRALRDVLVRRCASALLVAYEVPPIDPSTQDAPRLDVALEEPSLRVYQYLPSSAWRPLKFESLLDEHMLVAHLLGPAVGRVEESR